MDPDPRRPLIDALRARRWTLERLIATAGLKCSRGSLHRKLYGYRKPGTKGVRVFQPLSIVEYRALGVALEVFSPEELAQLNHLAGLGTNRAA